MALVTMPPLTEVTTPRVVERATLPDRARRHRSVAEFAADWRASVGGTT